MAISERAKVGSLYRSRSAAVHGVQVWWTGFSLEEICDRRIMARAFRAPAGRPVSHEMYYRFFPHEVYYVSHEIHYRTRATHRIESLSLRAGVGEISCETSGKDRVRRCPDCDVSRTFVFETAMHAPPSASEEGTTCKV